MENQTKYLSLAWFKSKLDKAVETVAEKVITKKIEGLVEELSKENVFEEVPYHSSIGVNNTLTVVLKNGQVLTKSGVETEDLAKCKTEDDVIKLMSTKEAVEEKQKFEEVKKEVELIQSNFDILVETEDFEVIDGSVYLKGVNRSVPKLLIKRFAEIIQKQKDNGVDAFCKADDINETLKIEYQSLIRFWYWTCLNSRAEVADKLYDFLEKNSFKINKYGFFAALRNVVTVNTEKNKELVDFISNAYNKIKAVWKKNPSNYIVHKKEDNSYFLLGVPKFKYDATKDKSYVGNLKDLYLDLPNLAENRYTDDWTKTFDIRIGQVVNMKPEDCCWSTQDCAASGLHFTSDQINYVGCGDTSVLVLINPMTVVGIGEAKGRCYEYFPVMTVPREEATQILHDVDFDTIDLGEEYTAQQIESLEERVKENIAVEAKKHEFNLPTISTKEITNIVKSLEQIKKEITNRVVTFN